MIADDSSKARVGHEQLEDFATLWTLRDQIANGNKAVVCPEIDFLEQIGQLVVTSVNVTNYNRATLHPYLRTLRKFAVYCIADIQSTGRVQGNLELRGAEMLSFGPALTSKRKGNVSWQFRRIKSGAMLF